MTTFRKSLSLVGVGVASGAVLLLGGQHVLSLVSQRDLPQRSSPPAGLATVPVEDSTPSPARPGRQIPAPRPVLSHDTEHSPPPAPVQRRSPPPGAPPTETNIQAAKQTLQQALQQMVDRNPELRQRLLREARHEEPRSSEGAPAEPAGGVAAQADGARADVVPTVEQGLRRMLDQLQGNADVKDALQEAADRANQKGQ